MSSGQREAGIEATITTGGAVVEVVIPGGMLDRATADALVAVADRLSEDRSVRVITLATSADDFCAGPAPDLDPLSVDPDPAAVWSRLRPPVVAAVTGECSSVGLELVLATDVRLAGPGTRFALPDLAQGRLPCWGGTQRLSRAIRPAQAAAMMLLGSELAAGDARAQGLIHQVVDDPRSAARDLAAVLATRGPLALELAKEAVHRGAELPLRDGLRLEGDLNHQLAATEDRAEGLQAFFDKRPPDFAGR
jgi:enoyl-CoA hydratase/carnithine racemase